MYDPRDYQKLTENEKVLYLEITQLRVALAEALEVLEWVDEDTEVNVSLELYPEILHAIRYAKHQLRGKCEHESEHSFYYWILTASHSDTRVSDLANDVRDDSKFPVRSRSYIEIMKHLKNRFACEESLTALKIAFMNYEIDA